MNRIYVISTIALTLGACVPMEQAPLIYTSAQKSGIVIAATPTSASSVDITIGHSTLDAAYVPVEVAKHCQFGLQWDCNNGLYQPVSVRGENQQGIAKPPEATTLQNYATEYSNKNSELAADESKLSEVLGKNALYHIWDNEQQLKNTAASDAEKAVNSEADQSATAKLNDAKKNSKDEADKAKAEFAKYKDFDDAVVTAAKNKRDLAAKAKDKSWEDLQKVLYSGGTGAEFMGDALSVYGTFNDTSKAESGQASLTTGKIFSTGVAAQIVGRSAAIFAISDCLKSATAVIAQTDKNEQPNAINKYLDACQDRPSRSQTTAALK